MQPIDETLEIKELIALYFEGTYYGDAEKLKRAFHSDARITGILNNQYYDWSLTDFIDKVTVTPTAKNKDEKFDKKILLIDIENNAAMVKARVVVGDFIFTDYITLLKINKKWIIRNKSFTG